MLIPAFFSIFVRQVLRVPLYQFSRIKMNSSKRCECFRHTTLKCTKSSMKHDLLRLRPDATRIRRAWLATPTLTADKNACYENSIHYAIFRTNINKVKRKQFACYSTIHSKNSRIEVCCMLCMPIIIVYSH